MFCQVLEKGERGICSASTNLTCLAEKTKKTLQIASLSYHQILPPWKVINGYLSRLQHILANYIGLMLMLSWQSTLALTNLSESLCSAQT